MAYYVSSGVTSGGINLAGNTIYVLAGGLAFNTVVNSGGRIFVSNSGTANRTTLNSGGNMFVSNGGVVYRTILNDYAKCYLSSGAVMHSTTVNSGGNLDVSGGARANTVVVEAGGCVSVYSGGVLKAVRENGGYVDVRPGAVVTFEENTFSGLVLSVMSASLHSGTTAFCTTVNSRALLCVFNGGLANSTAINYKGNLAVSSGGMAARAVVYSGGTMSVFLGGTANNTTVSSGGKMIVSGGTANNTIVQSSAGFFVSNGALIVSTVVNGKGNMNVYSGAVVNRTTINEGGSVFLSNGAVAYSATVNQSASLFLYSGAVIHSTILNSGGSITVSSGGKVNGLTLNAGGQVIVYSGAAVKGIVENGGNITVSRGAVASFQPNVFSGLVLSSGTATVHSGTTALRPTLGGRGFLYVYEGGMTYNAIINSGALIVNSGGVANRATLNYGTMNIASGGTAYNTIINSGYVYVSSGGLASGTVINNGTLYLYDSGAVTLRTSVNGGYFMMYDGTIANNTVVNGGYMYIYDGALAQNTVINRSLVYLNGKAVNTTLRTGSMYVSSGGFVKGIDVSDNGWLNMIAGGVASNASINNTGIMSLRDGAFSVDTTVNIGGVVYCWPNGHLRGTLTIAGSVQDAFNTTVTAVSEYVFLVQQATTVSPYLEFEEAGNGIAANASITIDVTNAYGDYILIRGDADNYSSANIVIRNDGVTTACKIDGSPITFSNGKKVSLTVSGRDLKLSATGTDRTAPAVPGNVSSTLVDNVLNVSWGEVKDFSGVTYEVEYSANAKFSDSNVIATPAMKQQIILPSGKWYWRLRAVDGAGNKSKWTTAATATVNYVKNVSGQYNSTYTVNSDVVLSKGASVTCGYPGALQVTANDFTIDLEGDNTLSCSSIRNAAILFGDDAYWTDTGPHLDGTINVNGENISFFSSVSNCITAAGVVGNNLTVSFNGAASGSKNISFESTNPARGYGCFAGGILADGNLVINGEFGGTVNSHFDFSAMSANNRTSCNIYGFSAGKELSVNGDISGNLYLSAYSLVSSSAVGLDAGGELFVRGDVSGIIAATAESSAYAVRSNNRMNLSVTGILFAGQSSLGNDMPTMIDKLKNWKKNSAGLLNLKGQRFYAVYAGERSEVDFRENALIVGNIFMMRDSVVTVSDAACVYGDFSTYYSSDNTVVLKLNNKSLKGTRITTSSWNSNFDLEVDVKDLTSNGSYSLLEANSISGNMSVKLSAPAKSVTLSVGQSVTIGNAVYALNTAASESGSKMILAVSGMKETVIPEDDEDEKKEETAPRRFADAGDFNGDGSDMLAIQSGNSVSVYMNGAAWGLGVTLEDGWQAVGVGDFNGDNMDDILRVNGEGYVVGEFANGNGTFSPRVLNLKNSGWDILGTGDFDGNGIEDVLIANPTGASKSVGLLGYWKSGVEWTLINGYSPEWECVSTGDFTGDGKCDMLWRNSFTGSGGLTYNAYCIWVMDPPSGESDWRMVSVSNPAEWDFLCSGDFDGDGSHDIAMINGDGVVGVWGQENGVLNSWSVLSSLNPEEWTLAGVGDFNGDGTDDIAWFNESTGIASFWQIDDKQFAGWQNIATVS